MGLEDFRFLGKESIDNSIIKRDFAKLYHRQGDELNKSDQNIEFIFGDNKNYHQIGNADLNLILQYGKMILQIFTTMILFI